MTAKQTVLPRIKPMGLQCIQKPFGFLPLFLEELVQKSRCEQLLYAHHIEGNGVRFFEEICSRDLEGVVAERKDSPYKDDSKTWLKIKNPKYSQAEGRQDLLKRREAGQFPALRLYWPVLTPV